MLQRGASSQVELHQLIKMNAANEQDDQHMILAPAKILSQSVGIVFQNYCNIADCQQFLALCSGLGTIGLMYVCSTSIAIIQHNCA